MGYRVQGRPQQFEFHNLVRLRRWGWTGTEFTNGANGGCPTGTVVQDAAGNLYGTSGGNVFGYYFGAYIASTVFKLSPNSDGTWTKTILHTFSGPDGNNPRSSLIFDQSGNLYGTTLNGGGSIHCPKGCGVVFKLSPNADGTWTETVLKRFGDRPAAHPYGGLVFDSTGNLYGTTENGGTGDSGTIYKMSPNADGTWTTTLVHAFAGKAALHPFGHLVLDKAGNLWGTASGCGAGTGCYGTIFEIIP
jgi:uncharacterized repeat protein (TIGR03803 family)